MKAIKAQGKPEGKQVKAAEKKAVAQKAKAASQAKRANKPKPRKGVKPKKGKSAGAAASLDQKAARFTAEINSLRKRIVENESALAKKIAEKIGAEDALNKLLMRSFEEEKVLLASIRSGSARKQESLKHKIASLESVTKIYEEKSARIEEARRKHAALKRQLELIEKHAGV